MRSILIPGAATFRQRQTGCGNHHREFRQACRQRRDRPASPRRPLHEGGVQRPAAAGNHHPGANRTTRHRSEVKPPDLSETQHPCHTQPLAIDDRPIHPQKFHEKGGMGCRDAHHHSLRRARQKWKHCAQQQNRPWRHRHRPPTRSNPAGRPTWRSWRCRTRGQASRRPWTCRSGTRFPSF